MEKLRYLHNHFTNFDEIWHGDAPGTCAPRQLLTTESENPKWWPTTILNNKKIVISSQSLDQFH